MDVHNGGPANIGSVRPSKIELDGASIDTEHSDSTICNTEEDAMLADLIAALTQNGIQTCETYGQSLPPEAVMHDRAAIVPRLIVSPRSEWGVSETLRLLALSKMYERWPVSVKSGGHGYFNGAACSGIMINLGYMTERRVEGDVMVLQPGCILGQLIDTLVKNGKAVPHGDCFGVGAGGHFLTAGWDIALARFHGLGCQSVVGGRIVLWDGTIVDVNEKQHPDLLYAMRGGAAAGVGVVAEIRLRLLDQPSLVCWRFRSLCRDGLKVCVAQRAFASASKLPKEVSLSFRFHFEPDQLDTVCSLNVISLLPARSTLECLSTYLGSEVTSLMGATCDWEEKPLLDLRMVPASETLAANPSMLAEVTPQALHESPKTYWKDTVSAREMARSYFTSISYWVTPHCDTMFMDLYEAFQCVREDPGRERMYALIVLGGGRITELQHQCSMPLGQALARFEMHWDSYDDEERSRAFTDRISKIMESKMDRDVSRPYRGDIWREEQGQDVRLERILNVHDRRPCADA